MLRECLEKPLQNTVIDGEARNLGMKLTRALTDLENGKPLKVEEEKLDKKAAKLKAKREKKNKKNSKKNPTKKKAPVAAAKRDPNAIPVWLTDEVQAQRSRARVSTLLIFITISVMCVFFTGCQHPDSYVEHGRWNRAHHQG